MKVVSLEVLECEVIQDSLVQLDRQVHQALLGQEDNQDPKVRMDQMEIVDH